MTVAGQYAQNNPHKPMNAFFIHYYSSHALNGTPISSTALYLLILQSMQSPALFRISHYRIVCKSVIAIR